eukprot:3882064-Rhodomonas_salina.1
MAEFPMPGPPPTCLQTPFSPTPFPNASSPFPNFLQPRVVAWHMLTGYCVCCRSSLSLCASGSEQRGRCGRAICVDVAVRGALQVSAGQSHPVPIPGCVLVTTQLLRQADGARQLTLGKSVTRQQSASADIAADGSPTTNSSSTSSGAGQLRYRPTRPLRTAQY